MKMKILAAGAFLLTHRVQGFGPGLGKLNVRSSSYKKSLLNMSDMKSIAEKVLSNPQWPEEWPYSEQDLARMDESNDNIFYDSPRLVYHIDDFAVTALTQYYKENFKDGEGNFEILTSYFLQFGIELTCLRPFTFLHF